MKNKPVITIHETPTGRNDLFWDTQKNQRMTRSQFVNQIEKGKYDDYHVRIVGGIKTPASNPDRSSKNNLG